MEKNYIIKICIGLLICTILIDVSFVFAGVEIDPNKIFLKAENEFYKENFDKAYELAELSLKNGLKGSSKQKAICMLYYLNKYSDESSHSSIYESSCNNKYPLEYKNFIEFSEHRNSKIFKDYFFGIKLGDCLSSVEKRKNLLPRMEIHERFIKSPEFKNYPKLEHIKTAEELMQYKKERGTYHSYFMENNRKVTILFQNNTAVSIGVDNFLYDNLDVEKIANELVEKYGKPIKISGSDKSKHLEYQFALVHINYRKPEKGKDERIEIGIDGNIFDFQLADLLEKRLCD